MEIILNLSPKYNRILTVSALLFWASASVIHLNYLHHLYVWQIEAEAINKRMADIEHFQQAIQDGNTEGVQVAIKAGFDVNQNEVIWDCTHSGSQPTTTMLTFARDRISYDESFLKSAELSVKEKHSLREKYEAHKVIYDVLIKAGAAAPQK